MTREEMLIGLLGGMCIVMGSVALAVGETGFAITMACGVVGLVLGVAARAWWEGW